jgi:FHA domain/Domain of unknown function (DUF1707)
MPLIGTRAIRLQREVLHGAIIPAMAPEAPTPLPLRPSEADRERVVRALRRRSLEGRISSETFEERVGRAYAARDGAELQRLLDDLPPSGRIERIAVSTTARLSRLALLVERAWRSQRAPILELPAAGALVIGRAPGCDVLLPNPEVSRRHAEVRRVEGGWELRDLGSTNGTRVNGRRVAGPRPLRPGDEVSLAGFTLVAGG